MFTTYPRTCPYCKEPVAEGAKKCKHCGEILDETLKEVRQLSSLNQNGTVRPTQQWSPGTAAVLSLIIPGAGQMYKGAVGKGFVWLFAVSIAYCCFIVPGIILHLVCIVSATKGNPYQGGNDLG